MAMLNIKHKQHAMYLGVAELFSTLSKANKKKVGACIVTTQGIIIGGTNGTPSGTDNTCEDDILGQLVTRPEVIHAELNCILKASREGISVLGGTLYCTLSPCVQCSSLIIQAGIKHVLYKENYRCLSGVEKLKNVGIMCKQFIPTDDHP